MAVSAQDIKLGGRRRLLATEQEALRACDLADVIAAEFVNEQRSPFTAAKYLSVVSEWLAFCREKRQNPFEVTGTEISAYRDALAPHVAPATQRLVLSVLSSYYRKLADPRPDTGQPLVRANPVMRVKRPDRPDRADTRWLTEIEARQLLAAADTQGPRELGLVSLFLLYGQPPTWIGQLTCADVARDGQDGPTITTYGRRGYRCTVRLVGPARRALLELAAWRSPSEPLFPGRRSATLGRYQAALECERVNKTSPRPLLDADGQVRHITPRLLNATFVVLASRAGASAQDVVELTGFEYVRFTATAQRASRQVAELIDDYLDLAA